MTILQARIVALGFAEGSLSTTSSEAIGRRHGVKEWSDERCVGHGLGIEGVSPLRVLSEVTVSESSCMLSREAM